MNRLEETKRKGRHTLIAISVIAIAVYFGFTPLFEYKLGGVAGAVISSSFGAIFVIVLTMYLLIKQTEIEQESKRGEKVFEEKMKIYSDIFEKTEKMLDDGKISKNDEMKKLPFVMVRKAGAKYPGELLEESYTLEYGKATLTLQTGLLGHTDRCILVDDLVATGGSVLATKRLIEQTGASVLGVSTIIDLEYVREDPLHLDMAYLERVKVN